MAAAAAAVAALAAVVALCGTPRASGSVLPPPGSPLGPRLVAHLQQPALEKPRPVAACLSQALLVSPLASSSDLLLLDCGEAASREDRVLGTAVAGSLVCEVAFEDVLRGALRRPCLQAALEHLAAAAGAGSAGASEDGDDEARALGREVEAVPAVPEGSHGVPKQLVVICTGVPETVDQADVSRAVQRLADALWAEDCVRPEALADAPISQVATLEVLASPSPVGALPPAICDAATGVLRAGVKPQDGTTLAAAARRAMTRLGSAKADAAAAIAVGAETRGAALAQVQCRGAAIAAAAELEGMLGGAPGEAMGEATDAFGGLCEEALTDALAKYDALALEYEGTAAFAGERGAFERQALARLERLYRKQLKQLAEESWDRMRKRLVKLRVGDVSLRKEMEAAVADAEKHFRRTAARMVPAGAGWSAEAERRAMVDRMRDFVTERLQTARLQGAYVPGMQRRPIAVSLHWLSTHPFNLLDAIQDSLSYEEDMEFDPDFEADAGDGSRPKNLRDLPREVAGFSSGLAQSAER